MKICVALVSLVSACGLAAADTYSNNFESMTTGPLAGGADGRAPGNGAFWVPDNAATGGVVADGIGYNGSRGLVVSNRGNGFDGVIDNVHTPKLNLTAGESSVNTGGATSFTSSYRFRTGESSPVAGLDFKSESWGRDRTTWLELYEDGGSLSMNYSGVDSLGNFTDNVWAGNLAWGQWYRVDTTINFVDGDFNDVVTVNIYDDADTLLHTFTDTTWETYFRYDPEQAGNGNLLTGVDALQFQMRGSPSGSSVYVDDITYAAVPAPGALALLGLGGLTLSRRRR